LAPQTSTARQIQVIRRRVKTPRWAHALHATSVSPDQKSPIRFADAPDFRAIANAPETTPLRLNTELTNPHPTTPKLVLHPQEAAGVSVYISSAFVSSTKEFEHSQTDDRNKVA
jgi:hypothetical protein